MDNEDMDIESKRSLIDMEINTSNLPCTDDDCIKFTYIDDEVEGTASININVSKRNCTVNIQCLYCDNKLSPIETSSNPVIILLNKIGLLLCHSHIELRLWLRLS